MTSIEDSVRPQFALVRSETEVLLDQLRGIEAWTRKHRPTHLLLDAALSREARSDIARRQEVVERERQALTDWTAHQLRENTHPLRSFAVPRAVIVHRNAWFKGKLTTGLAAGGITVVADLENGADGVGVVVAEQPDLLLLEHKLPMVTGLDVTRAVRCYAPSTVVVAQVTDEWEVGPFLEAGATTAYTRRIPPADIVADVCALLAA